MNSKLIPASRPQMTKEQLLDKIFDTHPDAKLPEFFIAGLRGYYLDSMGDKGKNDRKLYDDAIFLVSKDGFEAFNANTDPAGFRLNIANLKAGIWPVYKFDKHRGQTTSPYLALCQRAGDVAVVRDGKGEDIGSFGINIHCGGAFSTSSLGCQTLPPVQWKEFIAKAQAMAEATFGKDYAKQTYTYILLENAPAN